MPRINIVERDETLTTVTEQLYNVVYVPGFSVNPNMASKTPITFTSYATFQSTVGTQAAVFADDVTYESVGSWDSEDAVPEGGILFEKDSKDPSYAYASELLAQGVPVIYEKVNDSTSDTVLTSSGTPKDFTYGTSAPVNAPGENDGEYYLKYTLLEDDQNEDNYSYVLYKWNEESEETNKWEVVPSVFYVTWSSTTPSTPYRITIPFANAGDMYNYLKTTRFVASPDNELYDRNALQIKYLTTGGYPVFEYDHDSIIDGMLALAKPNDPVTSVNPLTGRGDCVVLIDHTNNPDRPLIGEHSVIQAVQGKFNCNYAAMFSPWFNYGGQAMPGSFAYLISMAESVKTNPNWLAIAGVNRGVIPQATGLATNKKMTRAIADSYMTWGSVDAEGHPERSTFINPITSVRPYGLTIWGNRTLAATKVNSDQALYYLNMRSLVAEIKKACYFASEQLMFEQNSDVLWVNFKSKITPLLDQMASSYGISGYKIIKELPDNQHQLKCTIKIFPIYAVEDFDITVILTNDDEVIVEE